MRRNLSTHDVYPVNISDSEVPSIQSLARVVDPVKCTSEQIHHFDMSLQVFLLNIHCPIDPMTFDYDAAQS